MTSPCVLKLRPESCFVWTQWPWHQFIRDVRARCNEIPSRRSWGNMVMGTAGTDDGRTTRNHTTTGHDYHQRGGINVIDIAVSHVNDMWVNQYTSKIFFWLKDGVYRLWLCGLIYRNDLIDWIWLKQLIFSPFFPLALKALSPVCL